MNSCNVAIIGAGPYGLSIAAHLRAAKVDFRIFGSPMRTWFEEMPRGMRLKSDGIASSLYDPDSQFTLEAYCRENGLPYADVGIPVPLETFVAYGLEFQRRFVPHLEEKCVVTMGPANGGYQLRLDDGEVLTARRVIVAVGLSYYQYVPPLFSALPETHVTHSSKHKSLDRFKGKKVLVVGAGASALDIAALLHQAEADVRVVARTPVIRLWPPPPPPPRSLLQWIRKPMSGLGRGWRLYLCATAPLIFRLMPEEFRLDKVKRVLGPNPAWFIKKDIEGKVPLCTGLSITEVSVENEKVKLAVTDIAGAAQTLEADHLIAATGYRVDLRRLPFFAVDLLKQIESVENTPVLSSNFESSLPGLYFVGASAANTFGPVLRFAVGAKFTATRLTKHLAKAVRRNGIRNGGIQAGQETIKAPNGLEQDSSLTAHPSLPLSSARQTTLDMRKHGVSTSIKAINEAPKVLLAENSGWSVVAMLAVSMAKAGIHVSAVCPAHHPLRKTRAVRQTFPYRAFRPLQSLETAIKASSPDMIIPCDDRALGHFHELYNQALARGHSGQNVTALIAKSLGSPKSYPVVWSRHDLLKVAHEEGLRVPDTEPIESESDVESWQRRHAFPWLLKADGIGNGRGVRFVRNAAQSMASYSELTRFYGLVRAIKHLCIDRDPFWLRPWWNAVKPAVIAQSNIHGRPANYGVVCWQGVVLASTGVEVVNETEAMAHSSVVRVVDNPDMMLCAERIARRLGLSGFFGLDFMIEEKTGLTWLIEMNPRPTRLSSLRLGAGRDPVGSLYAQLSGIPAQQTTSITQKSTIAYFPEVPGQWSKLAESCYHDVPEGEPELMEALRRPWPTETCLFRLIATTKRVHSFLGNALRKGSAPNPEPTLEDRRAPLAQDRNRAFPGQDHSHAERTLQYRQREQC